MAVAGRGIINKGLIGKGAFGCVYLVESPDGEQFAIKVMEWLRAGPTNKGVVENELRILKELSHQHVLCYVDHFQDGGLMYIITEYCSGGDLSGFLDHTGEALPEDLLLVWLWQMACGLEYMHTHENGPVLHRDLKPSNVFLSDKRDVRLGDMGIARKLEKPGAMAETFCGTPPYMSPEALREKPYNAKTDIWSLGCCVVEMATLERAYDGSSIFLLRNAVLKMRQPLPQKYSRELDRLVSKMMLPNFEERTSATDILDDSILQHCEDAEPMKLITRHGLHHALVFHRRASPTSTTTKAPSTSTTTSRTAYLAKADETVLTLSNSMTNLAAILDEGEPISIYRVKIDRRMHGRRPSDDTITNTGSVQTVLYKPQQTAKSKTTKKMPKVPTVVKRPTGEADDSLSRPVLSFMNTAVTTIGESRTGFQARSTGTVQDTENPTGEASGATQTEMLRNSLAQVIGTDSLRQASALVGTATDRQQLMSGLAPLVGESNTLLSNIVIYMLLKEYVSQASSGV